MRETLMALHRVRSNVFAWCIFVFRGRESPSLVPHMPVYGGVGDYVFKAFEFANNECAVRPRAGIGYLFVSISAHPNSKIMDEKEKGRERE